MKKFLVPSIVLSAFVVSSAMAADLPIRKAPSVPPPVVYTQRHLSADVGWGFSETDITDRSPRATFGFRRGFQHGFPAACSRLELDRQRVLGAEVDYSRRRKAM